VTGEGMLGVDKLLMHLL